MLKVNVWLEGVQIHENKLYKDRILCVPQSLQNLVAKEQHVCAGHLLGEKLLRDMGRRYEWEHPPSLRIFVENLGKSCKTWQANAQIKYKLGPIEPVPVPSYVGTSVCIDIFLFT